jgi:hypothetical protein
MIMTCQKLSSNGDALTCATRYYGIYRLIVMYKSMFYTLGLSVECIERSGFKKDYCIEV